MDYAIWLPDEISIQVALVLVAISYVTSAISAAFGLGGGVAMLIALLSVSPPIVALPVHALVQVGSNAGRALMLRSHIIGGVVRWFIPGSIIGVLVASQLIVDLPIQWLQLILALFILWSVWAQKPSSVAVSDKAYIAVGGMTSFATMFLGATGPLLAAFLSPERYGKHRTVATHAMCMCTQHLIKIVAFGFLGFVLTQWLLLVMLMIASGLLGTWTGAGLLQRLPETAFKWMFKSVLTLLALRLLYRALVSLS